MMDPFARAGGRLPQSSAGAVGVHQEASGALIEW